MSGHMTPAAAAKCARTLHERGELDVTLRMTRARPGPLHYQGDDERRAGKTATVDVITRGGDLGLEELTAIRDKIRELGYDAELDNGSDFAIVGEWRP